MTFPCRRRLLLLVPLLLVLLPSTESLAKPLNRRNVLLGTAASGVFVPASMASAATDDTVIDMEAIQTARNRQRDTIPTVRNSDQSRKRRVIISTRDPLPLLSINGGKSGSSLTIPRVGYSLYKTAPDQAPRCTALALLAGVRHFDVATQYGTNTAIAKALLQYLNAGMSGLDSLLANETPELLSTLRATSTAGEAHAKELGGSTTTSSIAPPPDGSIGRRGRRDSLFVHHKLSNEEQSVDKIQVKRAVKNVISQLGCTYLDMVSIHSPLSTKDKRLYTYEALLELRNAGFCKSVGVCNFGLGPLQEIASAGLELPAMNQLELSPFNTHDSIVDWCNTNGVAIGCSTWSKLSSTQAIQDAWLDVVGGIAKKYSKTKAQVLIRWSLQKGYVCVPRSAAATKIERLAIGENSYGGVSSFVLSDDDMKLLDGLNVSLKAGTLGRRDGWEDSNVSGDEWDPTDVV